MKEENLKVIIKYFEDNKERIENTKKDIHRMLWAAKKANTPEEYEILYHSLQEVEN